MITVVRAGVCLVQDAGRGAFAALGVPESGAWDRDAYAEAAWLLGQPAPPVLELLGGRLQLTTNSALAVAVVGPGRSTPDARDRAVRLEAGDSVVVEHVGPGPVYVGLSGLQLPLTLGSASTCRTGIGPAPLRDGDLLATDDVRTPAGRALRAARAPAAGPLRFVAAADLDPDVLAARHWTVAAVARNGVRLTPDRLIGSAHPSPASGPVVPGTVQLPTDDEAIVLGPDSGTTGGYAVAGVVIGVDLPRLARCVPGGRLTFAPVDVATARRLWAERPTRRLELGALQ